LYAWREPDTSLWSVIYRVRHALLMTRGFTSCLQCTCETCCFGPMDTSGSKVGAEEASYVQYCVSSALRTIISVAPRRTMIGSFHQCHGVLPPGSRSVSVSGLTGRSPGRGCCSAWLSKICLEVPSSLWNMAAESPLRYPDALAALWIPSCIMNVLLWIRLAACVVGLLGFRQATRTNVGKAEVPYSAL
jgi:hypothetical protein